MRKVTKNNYRQYYKEYYGIEFGEDYSVHHIDMNRDNNNISNLLLLPKKLHNRLHFTYNIFKESIKDYEDISSLFNPMFSDFNVSCAKKYFETIIEVRKWYVHKVMEYSDINLI